MTHPDQRQMDQATRARAVLDLAGLDLRVKGKYAQAEAIVGPTLRGWRVSIDLEVFDRLVGPLLRAAIDHPEIAAEHDYQRGDP